MIARILLNVVNWLTREPTPPESEYALLESACQVVTATLHEDWSMARSVAAQSADPYGLPGVVAGFYVGTLQEIHAQMPDGPTPEQMAQGTMLRLMANARPA